MSSNTKWIFDCRIHIFVNNVNVWGNNERRGEIKQSRSHKSNIWFDARLLNPRMQFQMLSLGWTYRCHAAGFGCDWRLVDISTGKGRRMYVSKLHTRGDMSQVRPKTADQPPNLMNISYFPAYVVDDGVLMRCFIAMVVIWMFCLMENCYWNWS